MSKLTAFLKSLVGIEDDGVNRGSGYSVLTPKVNVNRHDRRTLEKQAKTSYSPPAKTKPRNWRAKRKAARKAAQASRRAKR